MKTLLIIDMQNAWLTRPNSPCHRLDEVVNLINHAARQMRQQGGQVIFVRHSDEEAPHGSDAWQVLATLEQDANDKWVEKQVCDSFVNTDLAAKIGDCESLYICGFASEFCVDTTVRAAANLGYSVVVLGDAHTTANRPHLPAAAIVAHHSWIWANMSVPAKQTIQVKNTMEVFPACD